MEREFKKGNLFHFKNLTSKTDYCSANLAQWHDRLGHANINQIKAAENHNSVERLIISNKIFNDCETCLKAKQTRATIPKDSHKKSNKILERIHSDICGPLSYVSERGNRYFITYIDEASDKCWIYLLKTKSE